MPKIFFHGGVGDIAAGDITEEVADDPLHLLRGPELPRGILKGIGKFLGGTPIFNRTVGGNLGAPLITTTVAPQIAGDPIFCAWVASKAGHEVPT